MGTKWKDRNVSEINKQIGPLDYTSYLRHSKRLRSVQCTYTQCKKCLGYTSVQNRLYLSLKTRDSLFPTDIFQPRVEEKQNYPPKPHSFRLLNYERFIKHKTIFLRYRSTETAKSEFQTREIGAFHFRDFFAGIIFNYYLFA